MTRSFPTRVPREHVYRIAVGANPLAFRPWHTISVMAPMSGRWDDPEGSYRVLYTSASEHGALREALQHFRPAPALLARLAVLAYEPAEANIACDASELRLAGHLERSPIEAMGSVPVSWLRTRTLSQIRVESGRCVPICTESALDVVYQHCGIRFVVGELLAQNGLAWTRYISRMVWRKRIYSGIEAPSKFGTNLRNYAFFEDRPHSNVLRAKLDVVRTASLDPEDRLLGSVVRSLGLRLEASAISCLIAA